MTAAEKPLARVRVTAPRPGEPLAAPSSRGSDDAASVAAGSTVLVRGLIRSQLRLAVLCAIGFAVTLAGLGIVAALPALQQVTVAGVPVGWLVLAFGAYPPLIAIAAIAAVAATRTESQYRALADRR